MLLNSFSFINLSHINLIIRSAEEPRREEKKTFAAPTINKNIRIAFSFISLLYNYALFISYLFIHIDSQRPNSR